MTHTPPAHRDCTPAEAIAHALDDHWLTTPPGEPIYHVDAAQHVLAYLDDHGYTITQATRHQRSARPDAVVPGALALACLAAALLSAAHGAWGWTTAGITGTCLLAYEFHQDLTGRRHT